MSNRFGYRTIAIVLLVLTTACNFPGQNPDTSGVPTADATLTALFAPLASTQTQMAIPTAKPQDSTQTQLPIFTPTETITNTSLPTLTTRPTITAVPPTLTSLPVRPGPRVTAAFLTVPPVLDGDWGDWTGRTRQYPANTVVYGAGNWTGSEDLEASFIAGWDYTYLYISFKVNDDNYVQNASGQDIYKGDSVELLIDTNLIGDFYVTTVDSDDYQLGVSPGNPYPAGTREAFLWIPNSSAGTRPQVNIASIGGDGQYRIEMAIPWTILGFYPGPGLRLGFIASVSDNDDDSSNVQQTMISNTPGRNRLNPTTWGELILNP